MNRQGATFEVRTIARSFRGLLRAAATPTGRIHQDDKFDIRSSLEMPWLLLWALTSTERLEADTWWIVALALFHN